MKTRAARFLSCLLLALVGCAEPDAGADGAVAPPDGGIGDDARPPRPSDAGRRPRAPGDGHMPPDLGYVDTASPEWERFYAYVADQLEDGAPYPNSLGADDAAYVYRVTGEARFCELAVAITEEEVAEAEAAVARGERPRVARDSYLHVGREISALALAYDWCADFVTDAQRARWAAHAEQAIWNLWNHRDAEWGGVAHRWSGWSVENPGNNYHYSFLQATLYWALASHSDAWMELLRTEKLPPLIAYYRTLPGGGSREGTGYGLAQQRLFHIYRVWWDATGEDLAAESTHAADSLDYWIHATTPGFEYTAPIGDQARVSMPRLYDYHRAMLLEGSAVAPGSPQARRAAWWLRRIPIQGMTSRFNYIDNLLPVGEEEAPSALAYHAEGTGHLFMRSSWDDDATWLSFVAGPYDEAHAHDDQGAFNLFRRGWLAVTANVHSRTGIEQDLEYQNLVRFTRAGETIPQTYRTTSRMTVSGASVTADLAAAYGDSPDVTAWTRDIELAAERVDVVDRFTVAGGVEAVWQLHVPVEPRVMPDGTLVAGDLHIEPLSPADPAVSIEAWSALDEQVSEGWRVELRGGASEYRVRLRVLP